MTYKEYLEEKHGEVYHGTDDDMPDAFDAWVSNLDSSETADMIIGFIKEKMNIEKSETPFFYSLLQDINSFYF